MTLNKLSTMRDVFIQEIYTRMKSNREIFFLSADFGAPMLDRLKEDFSDRFINVGIAEQNLINIATGLALEGFTVYAYGMAPFLIMRAYEQIRINLAMLSQVRKINVNLIGVGAGLSYEVSGPTHHCLEDIGIVRMLPNIMLCSPSDSVLARKLVDLTMDIEKPKYLRFDGRPLPNIYDENQVIKIENGFFELFAGKDDVCIVSTGYMTHKAMRIRDLLKESKIDAGIIDVFLLKPLDEELLFNTLKKYKYITSLEEGFLNKGGLDALITGIVDKYDNFSIKLNKMGFRDKYIFEIGSREHLHQLNQLSDQTIVESIKKKIMA